MLELPSAEKATTTMQLPQQQRTGIYHGLFYRCHCSSTVASKTPILRQVNQQAVKLCCCTKPYRSKTCQWNMVTSRSRLPSFSCDTHNPSVRRQSTTHDRRKDIRNLVCIHICSCLVRTSRQSIGRTEHTNEERTQTNLFNKSTHLQTRFPFSSI